MIIETCPALENLSWLRHGFYGSDNAHAVTKELVGIHPFSDEFERALFLNQQHGDGIITANDDPTKEADAALTDQDNIALTVKTADCAPILLVCTDTRMIAAVHAGWPGTLNQIVCKTVCEMKERGANTGRMIAAIRHCLQMDSFAIQADVRDKFAGHCPDTMDFIQPFEDRWKMDMVGIIRQQLKKVGVHDIWASRTDTFTHTDYSSYRRRNRDPDSEKTRNVSILMKINP